MGSNWLDASGVCCFPPVGRPFCPSLSKILGRDLCLETRSCARIVFSMNRVSFFDFWETQLSQHLRSKIFLGYSADRSSSVNLVWFGKIWSWDTIWMRWTSWSIENGTIHTTRGWQELLGKQSIDDAVSKKDTVNELNTQSKEKRVRDSIVAHYSIIDIQAKQWTNLPERVSTTRRRCLKRCTWKGATGYFVVDLICPDLVIWSRALFW